MNGPSFWAGAERKRGTPDLRGAELPLGPPGLAGWPSSPGLGKNVGSDLLHLYTHNLHSLQWTSLRTAPTPIPVPECGLINRGRPPRGGGGWGQTVPALLRKEKGCPASGSCGAGGVLKGGGHSPPAGPSLAPLLSRRCSLPPTNVCSLGWRKRRCQRKREVGPAKE